MKPLAIVVAVARNGIIGRGGQLPWDLPEDRRHFRALTTGHAIILGRRTYEEINKPLPNRRNIVVSRTPGFAPAGCEVATSFDEAVRLARETDEEPRVIGGAGIYREALPLTTTIHLTEVDLEPEGDTRLDLDLRDFVEVSRRRGEDPRVTFVELRRRDPA